MSGAVHIDLLTSPVQVSKVLFHLFVCYLSSNNLVIQMLNSSRETALLCIRLHREIQKQATTEFHNYQNQQEAQLLLGDRATRKHAKDCWNGRGNDNLGWNDLQMYFKVIKIGTKLVYDFLLVVYSNFCRITHRFWEIWCEKVQWPWNMPKVIDRRVTWKLSCGHVCKIFGRQWTNEAKIVIFNYTLIWRPLSSEPPRIAA